MHKGRLEAFSDGVLAILITIMVLNLQTPKGQNLTDLFPVMRLIAIYALSFVFLAIYWNNHHHMFQAAQKVSGAVLWSNAHLLFWLSLVPFTTAWMGQHAGAPWPVAIYGINLLLCGIAYYILSHRLIAHHGKDSPLAIAYGNDNKGKISLLIYLISIPLAFFRAALAYACFIAVAIIWLVPDRRIERVLKNQVDPKLNHQVRKDHVNEHGT
jgi:uncharacterized membrane protein